MFCVTSYGESAYSYKIYYYSNHFIYFDGLNIAAEYSFFKYQKGYFHNPNQANWPDEFLL